MRCVSPMPCSAMRGTNITSTSISGPNFGLDQYGATLFPYWKTETVEAMDAFRHKHRFRGGRGGVRFAGGPVMPPRFSCGRDSVARPIPDGHALCTRRISWTWTTAFLTNNRRPVDPGPMLWFNARRLWPQLGARSRTSGRNNRVPRTRSGATPSFARPRSIPRRMQRFQGTAGVLSACRFRG